MALILAPSAYAGKVELTTYYPAPYGEYTNLKSTSDSYFATASGSSVVIGTTNPASDGRLTVQGAGTGNVVLGNYNGNTDFGAISLNGQGLGAGGANFFSSAGNQNLYINRPAGFAINFVENNAIQQMSIGPGGNVGIGTASPQGALDVTSTTSGLIPPRMTTAQKNAIPAGSKVAGAVLYDTDLSQLQYYNGSSWVGASGGGPGSWTCQTVSGAWGAQSSVTCPVGTNLITGGCEHGAPVQIWSGHPSGNGWYCLVGAGSSIQACARCCQ